MTLNTHWDIICVGAGISSLAFAAHLTKLRPDLKILILEKHSIPGGYASMFQRRKSRFDCSLHKMSGALQGGNLHESLVELGIYENLEFTHTKDLFGLHAPNFSYLELSAKADELKLQLICAFPEESKALEDFFREVQVFGGNGYHQLKILNGAYDVSVEDLRYARKHLRGLTAAKALDEKFKSPLLKAILSLPCAYCGGFPEDLAYLYYLHLYYALIVVGTSYVKGSSQHLTNRLVSLIEDNQGRVLLKTNVTKVLIDDESRAIGVETSKGNFFAPEIVINASPHFAVDNFFDNKAALSDVQDQLSSLVPSYSTSTLYGITDLPPESLGLLSTETILFSSQYAQADVTRARALAEKANGDLMEKAFWEVSAVEVTNYHLLDPQGGYVFIVNALDLIDHWPERKTDAYELKKKRLTEVLMERLYEACPKLRGHVTYLEASTPRTYERYTNNTFGAGYGARMGPDGAALAFQKSFPFKGVQFLSSWIQGPCYEAAFGSARLRAMSYR